MLLFNFSSIVDDENVLYKRSTAILALVKIFSKHSSICFIIVAALTYD